MWMVEEAVLLSPDEEIGCVEGSAARPSRPILEATIIARALDAPPEEVRRRACQAFAAALRVAAAHEDGAAPREAWEEALPKWFLERCRPEMTRAQWDAELAQRQRESPTEQARLERETAWTLDNWTYWLQPSMRSWWWLDSRSEQERVVITLAIDGWPFGWDSLRWLLRASGAHEVVEDVDA